MIKAILCDGDGTLRNGGSETLRRLQNEGLLIGIASGTTWGEAFFHRVFKKAGLEPPAVVLTRANTGKKGSGAFVKRAAQVLDIEPHEILLLGDAKYDIFEALNGGALPATARYSGAKTLEAKETQDYGLLVEAPHALYHYIHTFGQIGSPYFGWRCAVPNSPDEIYALRYQHTNAIKAWLKDGQDTIIVPGPKRSIALSQLLFHDLAAAIFHSGLRPDIITTYPGHTKGSINPRLSDELTTPLRQIMRAFTSDPLLQRTRTIPSSHSKTGDERRRRALEHYRQQRSSLTVDTSKSLKGKTVMVIDDFTTTGISFEAARHLLHEKGAKKVIGVAIGKFSDKHTMIENGKVLHLGGKSFPTADKRFQEIIAYYQRHVTP